MSTVREVGSGPPEEWQDLAAEGVFAAPLVQTDDTCWPAEARVRALQDENLDYPPSPMRLLIELSYGRCRCRECCIDRMEWCLAHGLRAAALISFRPFPPICRHASTITLQPAWPA